MLEKIVVLLVVGVIAMMFFGNRLPQVLGDLGKGIKAFKEGMNEGGKTPEKPKGKAATAARKPAVKKAAKKPVKKSK